MVAPSGTDPRDAAFSETRRQVVHLAMGGFALLLPFLSWWQAALAAISAFLFNLCVLPRVGGRSLFRPADRARGYPSGILIYPLSVLLLILLFPDRVDLAAAGWGIMAAGDSLATIVGRRSRGARLPWNADKTFAGSIAFMTGGFVIGTAFALWARQSVTPAPSIGLVVAAVAVAAFVAALVESIPVRLDDNISVPISAAFVLWSLQWVRPEAWRAAAPDVWNALLPAVAINVVAASAGWIARTVSITGAVGGALIGILVYATTGLGGWILLLASFALASVTSRLGLDRKRVLGIAQEGGGRRGAGNAVANCGLAVWAGLLAVLTPYRDAALLVFVASLAAGASDTVASEIGKAWGRRTLLVPSFRPVRPGTSGAISLEGTCAGIVAAFGLAALGAQAGLIHLGAVWCVVVGATVGSLVESALGASLEAPGVLNNDLLNFVNTTVASIVAIALLRVVS